MTKVFDGGLKLSREHSNGPPCKRMTYELPLLSSQTFLVHSRTSFLRLGKASKARTGGTNPCLRLVRFSNASFQRESHVNASNKSSAAFGKEIFTSTESGLNNKPNKTVLPHPSDLVSEVIGFDSPCLSIARTYNGSGSIVATGTGVLETFSRTSVNTNDFVSLT